ncbi:MAG TPA: DUF934 domain-containing protein [Steroidobacteraceae bacterium]|nr:DUF934 domain-containing protein [Steroidobacteraceae bacterium]
MRHILRRRELLTDEWRYLGEEAADTDPLIVPVGQLRTDPLRSQLMRRSGALGARLGPADAVEEVARLAGLLPRLALVALEFPSPGDGRGYSQARLLRGRFAFRGELRAIGAGVRQDQAFLLARCGFDSLEPPPGTDLEAVRRAFSSYNVAYQPGSTQLALRQQRFGPFSGELVSAPGDSPPNGELSPKAP